MLCKREIKSKIPAEKLITMAEFVLKNNSFEFDGSVEQQVSGSAIGTKCTPTYVCKYMEAIGTEFLKTHERTPIA